MDSSIWVATITGLPALRQARTIRREMLGTSSGGSSTPRSPRATMTASDSSMISSSCSIADGFSSFVTRPARPAMASRSRRTSRGRWTKEAATQSTPSSIPSARSRRSLPVSGEMGSMTWGMLTPLWFEISPPILTRVPAKFAPHVSTSSLTLPSSTRRFVPGFSAAKTSGWGSETRSGPPGAGSRSKTNEPPSSSIALPPASRPIRSFGPCKSRRIPMGRPVADSIVRIASRHRRWPSWSPWLKLSRNTSTPAANSDRMVSGVDVAGPRVAMIFAKRCRRIGDPVVVAGEGRVFRARTGRILLRGPGNAGTCKASFPGSAPRWTCSGLAGNAGVDCLDSIEARIRH